MPPLLFVDCVTFIAHGLRQAIELYARLKSRIFPSISRSAYLMTSKEPLFFTRSCQPKAPIYRHSLRVIADSSLVTFKAALTDGEVRAGWDLGVARLCGSAL